MMLESENLWLAMKEQGQLPRIPTEHKHSCAPLIEQLESPVVDGDGVDLEEVLENCGAGSGQGCDCCHPH